MTTISTQRQPAANESTTAVSARVNAAAAQWRGFWLAPMPSAGFALFRTGLGVLTFLWFATLIQDLDAFFGADSLALAPIAGKGTFNVYRLFPPSSGVLWLGVGLGLVASTMLIIGRNTRAAGPFLAILFASTMAENRMLWNAGDDLLQTFCLLFGLYCLLTPSADLDTPLRSSFHLNKPLRTGRVWLFQMIRIQMSIVYLVAGVAKIPGAAWRDGTATITVFRLETLERFPTPGFLETNFYVANIATWSTLVLECSLPLLLWNKRSRPYAVVAAVVFHIAIDWTLAIGLFSWIMILGLSAFWHPGSDTGSTPPCRPKVMIDDPADRVFPTPLQSESTPLRTNQTRRKKCEMRSS